MRRAARAFLGSLVAAAAVAGTAALSRAPYEATRGAGALLRLSWRARGERVEECRKLSPAELEALPPHMRRPEVCEGRVLPYVLTVRLDGREIVHDTIRGAGAREDRPLYVLREIPVAPGVHAIAVSFVREQPEGSHGRDEEDEDDEDARERGARWTPARLEIETTARLGPGEVGLVTFDPERRALLLRTAGDAP